MIITLLFFILLFIVIKSLTGVALYVAGAVLGLLLVLVVSLIKKRRR